MGLCLRRVWLQYPIPGWQVSPGISGSFQLESVATFGWNRWQVSTGISGNLRPEYAFIEQNDLTPACSILQGSEFEGAIREVCGMGIKTPGGTIVAYILFFNTPRTLSRPRWTPVSRAKAVASSRQLHWEWREPCSRGS